MYIFSYILRDKSLNYTLGPQSPRYSPYGPFQYKPATEPGLHAVGTQGARASVPSATTRARGTPEAGPEALPVASPKITPPCLTGKMQASQFPRAHNVTLILKLNPEPLSLKPMVFQSIPQPSHNHVSYSSALQARCFVPCVCDTQNQLRWN